MILLRYGIRCSLHYSVPLTLGLIAYTGSWQGVARNLMSETKAGSKPNPADAKATKVAAGGDGTDESAKTSVSQDRPEGESLAMNPDRDDTSRGLTIPKADSRRNRNSVTDSASSGNSRSRIDPDRPPRDSDIDATGHQTPIAQSEPNRPGPLPSAGMAAGAAGLAFVAVNTQDVAATQLAPSTSKPDEKTGKSPEPVSSPAALAANQPASEPGTNSNDAAPAVTAEAANSDVAKATQPADSVGDTPTTEPAHLNPQIRAIAAEVPSAAVIAKTVSPESSKPAEKPDIQTASQADRPMKAPEEVRPDPPAPASTVSPPAVVAATEPKAKENDPPEPPKVVMKADPKPESPKPSATIDRKNVEIPDVVIAQEGETWNRIAARIYGDEKMAETIWRENRDAHGGSSDAMPIAGRMVRLPEAGKRYSIPNSGQTQLARTAR